MPGVMEMAGELDAKKGKPAYVEFAAEAKHLPKQSEREGRYIAVDVDMVTVRQLGAPDGVKFEVAKWFEQNVRDVMAGRLPRAHEEYYKKAYAYWKEGQEMPLEGTPIRGWAVISPAQSEAIVRLGIRTVEQLATVNEEVMRRIGMGAVDMKNKALAWVAQANDKGPLTMKMAAMEKENSLLTVSVANLTEQVKALVLAQKPSGIDVSHAPQLPSEPDPLSAESLLGFTEDPQPQAKKKR